MPGAPSRPCTTAARGAPHYPRIAPVIYDLAIVGAGTAGLALARAARGLRVALVAPEVAPRAPGGEIHRLLLAVVEIAFGAVAQPRHDAV